MRIPVLVNLLILACTFSANCVTHQVSPVPATTAAQQAAPTRSEPIDSVRAGTGTIVGRVTDAKTGESLIGASVMVVGTHNEAATDERGRFRLVNIKPGRFSVVASTRDPDHSDQRIDDSVAASCTTHIEFRLKVGRGDILRF